MSRLEELIQKYCPDGVEYKRIGDCCEIKTGKGVTKKDIVENGQYEIISGGVLPLGKINTYNRDGRNVTIARAGSAGFVDWHEKPFYLNDKCFSIIPIFLNKIETKYLYYVLKNQEVKIIGMKSDGSVPTVNTEKVSSVEIPIPPLPVQQEIVRILDTFTELTAELTARKKQYEYYRDELLTFGDEVEEVFFGDVLDIVTDYVAAGSFADIAKNVQYISEPSFAQLVRTVDIKSGFQKTDPVYVNENAYNFLWRVNLNTECIIMPNIGVNCGEIYYLTPSMLPYEHNVLGPNAIMVKSSSANNKYLAYLFQCPDFQNKLRKIISPGGQTKFNKTELKKIKFLLPSLDIQERVVRILDNFNTLCNDISSGLPAEIEARQKQYEYYRDELLFFKRK